MIKNINLILLSFQVRFLNFNANIGSSETKRSDIITVIRTKTTGCKINVSRISYLPCSVISARAAIKSAFAGVGKPIKDSACRESMLNFANRRAEKTGINKDVDIQTASQIDKSERFSARTLIPKRAYSIMTI